MIISVTERGTFKRCRLMWDYSSFSRQSLTSLRPPTALAFGTLVHKIHEEWLLNIDEPVADIVIRVAADTQREIEQQYIDRVGVGPDARELEAFLDQVALAHEMFSNYEERWGASLPEGMTLIKPEQTIALPIPGTEHPCKYVHATGDASCADCENGVSHHLLEGTLDALMQDDAGRLWILERKTYNSKPRVDNMQMNDQFLAYLWALTKLDMGEVGGIIYDGMWKRFKEKRNLEDLFFRTPLIRSPEEIENFSVQLRDEALDMENPRIYRNARWEGCWDCQFVKLCQAEFRGEDADYVKEQFFTLRTRSEIEEAE